MNKRALELLEELRVAKLPVNRATLQTLGRKARDQLRRSAKSHEERELYNGFNASEHWAKNFITRNNLRSLFLHGEAESVDDQAIASGMAAVRKECEEYEIDFIFNVDETGLFYRVLPRRTYLAPGEKLKKSVKGVKGMTAKERVTAYVCVNASGTAKMPLAFIGTAANPRCLGKNKRLLPKDTVYFHHARVWSDARTFGMWFNSFLRFVRRFTSKPVLLLMDNHSNHANLSDPNGQVTVME